MSDIENKLQCQVYHYTDDKISKCIGVAFLIKHRNKENIKDIKFSDIIGKGRLIKAELKLNNKNIVIYNLYGNVNKQMKITQWNKLSKMIEKDRPKYDILIIAGDFNSTLSPNDRMGGTWAKEPIDYNLINLMERNGLSDVSTILNKDTHTFIGPYGTSLLDRFLINDNGKIHIKEYNNIICEFSDHNSIHLKLFHVTQSFKKPNHNKHWKLNSTLLDDFNIRDQIEYIWAEWRQFEDNFENKIDWYLLGKRKIKKFLIKQGIIKARKINNEENQIKSELNQLLTNKIDNTERILQLKNKLNKILEYKIEGIKIRTQETTMPNEEKGSKQFYNIEMKKNKTVKIEALFNEENILKEDENDLKEIAHNFYSKLYTSEGLNEESCKIFLENCDLDNKIDNDDRKTLNKQIQLNEIKKAINKMANNKSPGLDGLTREYYSVFYDILKYDLIDIYINIQNIDNIPTEFSTGLIKLLFKKGDPRQLKNWRPISLINTDMKILTSIITNRLKAVMHKFIKPHQTCGVKNRFIFENLITIEILLENIEYCKSNSYNESIIRSIDMEKAFDRVEHGYLYKILDKLNLGLTITNLIKKIYQNLYQIVQVGTTVTDEIKMTRGIRQGCSLSMALFSISIEPLIQNFNKYLQGISFHNNTNLKALAYADDTIVFLKNQRENFIYSKIIELYQNSSGAKINEDKTKEISLNLSKDQDPIEILGIYFHPKYTIRQKLNWINIIKKIKTKITLYNGRNMTIYGKATLCYSIVISNILYLSKIIPPTEIILKSLNTILMTFIKNEMPHNYTINNIQRPQQNGGFGIPNIKERITTNILMWHKYCNIKEDECIWKHAFLHKLRNNKGIIKTSIFNYLKDIEIEGNMENLTSKMIYQERMEKINRSYEIENDTKTTINWPTIWMNLYKENIDNKLKIYYHECLTRKICENVIKNKSGNCPGCDYPYIQSIEHILLNCRNIKPLIKYIADYFNYQITEDILYMKQDRKYILLTCIFLKTVLDSRTELKQKWGCIDTQILISYFKKICDKYVVDRCD